MSNSFRSGLSPEALARIEQVLKTAVDFVAEKRREADGLFNAYLDRCIDGDCQDRIRAAEFGAPKLIAGQIKSRAICFSAIACELFLISPTVAHFAAALDDVALDVASLLPYNQDVVRALQLDPSNLDLFPSLKHQWITRAGGRATILTATFERASPSFWRDLRVEFEHLDGADLQAVLRDDGWWTVCGGPSDPSTRQILTSALGRLIRRGLAALGVYDRSVSVHVWFDALRRRTANPSDSTIEGLTFQCADYCFELEKLSSDEESANSVKPALVPDDGELGTKDGTTATSESAIRNDRLFRKLGEFWTISFDGQTLTMKDAKGLAYIAFLLQSPHNLCLAADLVAAGSSSKEYIEIGSAGKIMDSFEMDRLKRHAQDLKDQLSEAQRNNDEGRTALIRDELEQIGDLLLAAKGFGRKSRDSHSHRERFRKSVSTAISRSIANIRKHHPTLADHLDRHIDRGHFLTYSSNLTWNF